MNWWQSLILACVSGGVVSALIAWWRSRMEREDVKDDRIYRMQADQISDLHEQMGRLEAKITALEQRLEEQYQTTSELRGELQRQLLESQRLTLERDGLSRRVIQLETENQGLRERLERNGA